MATTAFTASGTNSAVLALGKASWRTGIALSNLNEDSVTEILGPNIKTLAGEVKELSIECDLLFARLDEQISEIGRPLTADIDSGIWDCLATQVDEGCRTLQELELFVKIVRGEETKFIGQAQRSRKLDKSRDRIAETRRRVVRHINSFRLLLLLLDTVTRYLAPGQADQQLLHNLDKSQTTAKALQISSQSDPHSRLSHVEVTLIRYAHTVVEKGSAMYEANYTPEPAVNQHPSISYSRVTTWIYTLNAIRQNQQRPDQTNSVAEIQLAQTGDKSQGKQGFEAIDDDSDNDLETDLVQAALDTGAEAFERQDWREAESLLHEALRVMQQLSKQQHRFFDIFSLHYKLSICAYHTQEHTDAEEALVSLAQQSASSNEQRALIYNAMHLLSQLYVRIGHVDRARTECEKALQGRRRLLGKQSEASLESMALMAHIYVQLDNRPLAKSCLSMIPEARRDSILATVEASLGPSVEHLDFSSLLTPSMPKDSPRQNLEPPRVHNEASGSPIGLGMESSAYKPASTTTNSPSNSPFRPPPPLSMASFSLADGRRDSTATERSRLVEKHAPMKSERSPTIASSSRHSYIDETVGNRTLTRKEILEKVGCQPRDKIEEVVCAGDHAALVNLLTKKKSFWRSNTRKRPRPERVTALHFAALFGETDMARRLVDSNFNINEIPFGYSTSLTPLHFAIGARQIDMVDFLVTHGAKPSEPDTWSSLAGQLMTRSWLIKTMSESEREFVPHRMISIMSILLKHGWDVNAPIDMSGRTVLHQAVGFWTGAYQWDLSVRATVTSFLCERGAEPFLANKEGKTPYDLALASGHQDLLLILDHGSQRKEMDDGVAHLVELPS